MMVLHRFSSVDSSVLDTALKRRAGENQHRSLRDYDAPCGAPPSWSLWRICVLLHQDFRKSDIHTQGRKSYHAKREALRCEHMKWSACGSAVRSVRTSTSSLETHCSGPSSGSFIQSGLVQAWELYSVCTISLPTAHGIQLGKGSVRAKCRVRALTGLWLTAFFHRSLTHPH